ncbi:MAG: transcription elongation factor GreA [bacterium]|nr:transcription elongation factor GreA [bacterium]
MPQTHFVTEEGLQKLKEEFEQLKIRRLEIAKSIEEAKQLGDLSENASYTEALEAQSFNEGRIVELEDLIRNASIIEKQFTETVELGTTVEVEVNGGDRRSYAIVGSQEANPAEGRISNESPIGRALLGKRKGDAIDVKTPKGMMGYKVVSIK